MSKLVKYQTNGKVLTTLKNDANTSSNTKTKLLIEIGHEIYWDYRKGQEVPEFVKDKLETIKELDKKIHAYEAHVNELNKKAKAEVSSCSCGAQLIDADTFCQECGKKVEKLKEIHVETTTCHRCHSVIPATANFCNVCGIDQGISSY